MSGNLKRGASAALCLCGLLLMGCVTAPTRNEVAEFKEVGTGRVPVAKLGNFSDCVIDGFDRAHVTPSAFHARQVRRAGSTRIDTMLNNSVMISADIHDDGRVELHESSMASLLDLSGEKQTFAECLKSVPH